MVDVIFAYCWGREERKKLDVRTANGLLQTFLVCCPYSQQGEGICQITERAHMMV